MLDSVAVSEKLDLVFKIKRLGCRAVHSGNPQWPAEIVRAGRRAGHLQPAAVFLVGLVGVHKNVAIEFFRAGLRDRDLLVPAMLSTDGIGLHRKDKVLVYSGVLPMNPG